MHCETASRHDLVLAKMRALIEGKEFNGITHEPMDPPFCLMQCMRRTERFTIMPKRFRQTRRFPVAMTEDGFRRLRQFAESAELEKGEALSFLFEHFNSVTDHEVLTHRLRLFKAELADRKR